MVWQEVPVDGGPERLLIDGVYQTGWGGTRDAIYYVAHPTTELIRWDFRTRKAQPVARLGEGHALFGYALSVRRDRGAVAFSQVDADSLDLFTLTVPHWREI